ncbi:FISUMP domain-containing protein [Oceanihabitans sp. 2_MG-2023]|uniref:FISUMP domain-containing protein n=1 Tax=Oceanihabitans sp. 2_MG-2023 TaxID=3062661 RepID=UPI0026E4894B|nr:FISUMP domain-containing protein [Oceanihabitans sp. 2_MG-2023]MDO6597986.1 FISUMP domain-containing protein [Oceanihabitans sp. 2_MG-2023]
MKNLTKISTTILLSFFLTTSCIEDEIKDLNNSEDTETTITDSRDGQVYDIVKIGDQTWFAENLNYAGNIEEVTSTSVWSAIYNNGNYTEQPAWCYYNNDATFEDIFGKLYNWYAINTVEICPSGWRVPTVADWTTLGDYLGGEMVAGGKMKTTTFWNYPNTGADNSSGFNALPSGYRSREGFNGDFQNFGDIGLWWSATVTNSNSNYSFSYNLDFERARLLLESTENTVGLACRCIKN